jgi:hypothetical protein
MKGEDKCVICTVPAVRSLFHVKSMSVGLPTRPVVCNITLSQIISKLSIRTLLYSEGANLMIFNDELIIKLKMKVSVTLFILLIVKAFAHQEYDQSDPFQEYRQK